MFSTDSMAVQALPQTPLMPDSRALPSLLSAKAIWRDLPAWMFFIYGCLLLNTQLTAMSPPRHDLVHTIIFPLAVFLAFIGAHSLFDPHLTNRARAFGVPLLLCVALPTINVLWHQPSPLDTPALLKLYEYSNFFWAGLLILHAWFHQRSHVTLFFGVALVYGAALENGGIILGFFHEWNLGSTMVRPFVAPVATMIGWCVVVSMGTYVTWSLRRLIPPLKRSSVASALVLGTSSTMLDLQIDPIATALGCWVWHESLPAWFHGVPMVNFIAWMCALVPFGFVLFRVQERLGLDDFARWSPRQLGTLLLATPIALGIAALAFMLCTLLIEGPHGPSWALLGQFTVRLFS